MAEAQRGPCVLSAELSIHRVRSAAHKGVVEEAPRGHWGWSRFYGHLHDGHAIREQPFIGGAHRLSDEQDR
jgi:hypothetical protein